MRKSNGKREPETLEIEQFKQTVKENLDKLLLFYLNSSRSMGIYNHLDNPKNEGEAVYASTLEIRDLKYLLIKNITIELAKAFNTKFSQDKYTIDKLMDLIDRHPQYISSLSELDIVRRGLDMYGVQIKEILDLRNKNYAHSDSDFDLAKISLTKENIQDLIKVLMVTIHKISSQIGGAVWFLNERPLDIYLLEDGAKGMEARARLSPGLSQWIRKRSPE